MDRTARSPSPRKNINPLPQTVKEEACALYKEDPDLFTKSDLDAFGIVSGSGKPSPRSPSEYTVVDRKEEEESVDFTILSIRLDQEHPDFWKESEKKKIYAHAFGEQNSSSQCKDQQMVCAKESSQESVSEDLMDVLEKLNTLAERKNQGESPQEENVHFNTLLKSFNMKLKEKLEKESSPSAPVDIEKFVKEKGIDLEVFNRVSSDSKGGMSNAFSSSSSRLTGKEKTSGASGFVNRVLSSRGKKKQSSQPMMPEKLIFTDSQSSINEGVLRGDRAPKGRGAEKGDAFASGSKREDRIHEVSDAITAQKSKQKISLISFLSPRKNKRTMSGSGSPDFPRRSQSGQLILEEKPSFLGVREDVQALVEEESLKGDGAPPEKSPLTRVNSSPAVPRRTPSGVSNPAALSSRKPSKKEEKDNGNISSRTATPTKKSPFSPETVQRLSRAFTPQKVSSEKRERSKRDRTEEVVQKEQKSLQRTQSSPTVSPSQGRKSTAQKRSGKKNNPIAGVFSPRSRAASQVTQPIASFDDHFFQTRLPAMITLNNRGFLSGNRQFFPTISSGSASQYVASLIPKNPEVLKTQLFTLQDGAEEIQSIAIPKRFDEALKSATLTFQNANKDDAPVPTFDKIQQTHKADLKFSQIWHLLRQVCGNDDQTTQLLASFLGVLTFEYPEALFASFPEITSWVQDEASSQKVNDQRFVVLNHEVEIKKGGRTENEIQEQKVLLNGPLRPRITVLSTVERRPLASGVLGNEKYEDIPCLALKVEYQKYVNAFQGAGGKKPIPIPRLGAYGGLEIYFSSFFVVSFKKTFNGEVDLNIQEKPTYFSMRGGPGPREEGKMRGRKKRPS